MSLAEGTFVPSTLCPLYDSGARFGCSQADARYNESMVAGPPALDVLRFQQAFAGRPLFVVGDSLSEQHFRAAACALRAWNASATRIPAARCVSNWPALGASADDLEGADDVRAMANYTRVCYVQAGKGHMDRTAVDAFEAVERSGELVNDSVVVANEGIWFRVELSRAAAAPPPPLRPPPLPLPAHPPSAPLHSTANGSNAPASSSTQRGPAALGAVAATMAAHVGGDFMQGVELARAAAWARVDFGVLEARGIALLWRETAAQHFHTRRGTGMWPGRAGLTNERLPKDACTPLVEGNSSGGAAAGEQRRRVAATSRVLPSAMLVLPLFNASVGGWTSHIERHTPHGRSTRGRDCSHYCEPSPLFEGANAALLEVIAARSPAPKAPALRTRPPVHALLRFTDEALL